MKLAFLIISVIFLLFSLIWIIISRKKRKGISSIFAAIILVVSLGTTISSSISVKNALEVTKDDVSIVQTNDGVLEKEFELSAKKDIENLEITFTLYNSKGNVIGYVVKTLPFVDQRNTYLITITADDFSNFLSIKNCGHKITGGKGSLS